MLLDFAVAYTNEGFNGPLIASYYYYCESSDINFLVFVFCLCEFRFFFIYSCSLYNWPFGC
jgi:hypothetical protein